MTRLELGAALRRAQGADPASVPDIVRDLAAGFGGTDVVIYLVDFGQTTLEPLPDRGAHPEPSKSEEVSGTIAGRAFMDQHPVTSPRSDGLRVWVPIIEGSDRTGVLALTVPDDRGDRIDACTDLGLFSGYLIGLNARTTDVYNLHRRRRSLSLAASMQWDLLPPLLLKTDRVTVAGLVEPAYDVGGDCFDYAINDAVCDVAVFDAVGHNLRSSLIAALTVGSYRHDRREGRSLEHIHTRLDEVIAAQYRDLSFSTGQLTRLDLRTGVLQWTNAGHPLPMLVRHGQVIRQIGCDPTLPWGLGSLAPTAKPVPVASEALEPGDSVLFYSDGVVDARVGSGDGETFGTERLADQVGQHASDGLEPEQIVRRLARAVLEHHADELTDDATFVFIRWNGSR